VRSLVVAVALAAAITACGTPDELSRGDGRQLEMSRDRALAAAALRTRLASPGKADRTLRKVRAIVASGALEPKRLDEFGLAALGRLRLVAPSLVVVDRLEIPRELDRPGLTAFLANARTDPDAATKTPAQTEIRAIDSLIDDAGADGSTRIPGVEATVDEFRERLASGLQAVWPDLADEVSD
jgi:hypothetical protein